MADEIENIIDSEIERGDQNYVSSDEQEKQPVYRKIGDSRVPVARQTGSLWKSRKDIALRRRKNEEWEQAWNEAIRYYRNDQTAHRLDSDGDNDASEYLKRKMTRTFSETENIVFSNTSALVPSTYAKNPTFEITAIDPADESFGALCEDLVTRLFSKKNAPGINLKPKARKSIVMATLTNSAYIEIGYTFRQNSSEKAIEDLSALGEQLEAAKDSKEIERIEGELLALEETVDLLRPAGPWAKCRRPHDVVWDPDSTEEDRSDANWCMIRDYVSTTWLNAVYGKRHGDSVKSVYEPTHILSAINGGGDGEGHNAAEMEINQYTLLSDEQLDGRDDKSTYKSYGYDDENTFNAAKRTMVWYVWDRVTRRVYLFADKNWQWPVWVWDDPYKLQGFFPIYKLQYYTDPEEAEMRGEVSYYLDQQDAINGINTELARARQWARRNLFYDKNRISKDEVEKMLKGDEDTAVGVDVPEGMTLKDAIMPMLPPSLQIIELFDKGPIFEAIDRVSSVQPVMRGIEFKTNTTNQAINTYNSVQQTRLDEKIDANEEFIGKIGWGILQMCLQFMPTEQVAALLGDARAEAWENISADRIDALLQFRVTGGSTVNPTAESKKQQAMNMGQVLGQFVNAAPQPVLMAMLSVMRSAFNDTVPDEMWEDILTSVSQQQAAGPVSGGAAEGAPAADVPSSNAAGAAQPGDPSAVIGQLDALMQSLPDEAKQAIGQAVMQGVPIGAALERILPALQGQMQQPPAGNA